MSRLILLFVIIVAKVKAQNRCGHSWSDANENCDKTPCESTDAPCPHGEGCYADLLPCLPAQPPSLDPSLPFPNRCGWDWLDANNNCDRTPCDQTDSSCPTGQRCFTDVMACAQPPVSPPTVPATVPPSQTKAPTTPTPATPATVPPSQTEEPTTRTPTTPDNSCSTTTYMGYYGSWAASRSCNSLAPDEIDPSPYTHVIFGFAKLSPTYELLPYDTSDLALYPPFTALKEKKPSLKTTIAVGGWTHNSPGPTQLLFSQASSTDANRKTFAGNAVSFLRQHGFVVARNQSRV